MSASVTIHEINGDPRDLEHVRSLLRGYATEFAGSIAETLCFQGFETELAGLPGRYGPPGGVLLLAMDRDLPVGCAALRGLNETTCEMKRLFVVPAYRGIGLGRQLVEELLAKSSDLRYSRMVLDTLPEMEGAIRLYRELGFVDAGRYWNSPIERAIFLEKRLVNGDRSQATEGYEICPERWATGGSAGLT